MKTFKKILIVILALIVIVFIIALILPKSIQTERQITINSPVDSVFLQVQSLKNMSEWSPWKDYDQNMTTEFEGIDGEIGSKYSWKGNKQVGSGYQEITNIILNERIDIDLYFMEPYTSSSKVYFLFNEENNQTIVKWGFFQKTKVPSNLMMSAMGVIKMLNKDFDKGLSRLKERCEE